MLMLRESRIVRVVAVLLLAWLPACASLRGERHYDPSDPSFEENEPAEGLLVLTDGTSRRVEGIWVEGDSLFAFEPGTIGRVNEAQIRMARSEVEQVRSKEDGTLLQVGYAALMIIGLVGAFAQIVDGPEP